MTVKEKSNLHTLTVEEKSDLHTLTVLEKFDQLKICIGYKIVHIFWSYHNFFWQLFRLSAFFGLSFFILPLSPSFCLSPSHTHPDLNISSLKHAKCLLCHPTMHMLDFLLLSS